MARARQKTMDNETRCGRGWRCQELQRQTPLNLSMTKKICDGIIWQLQLQKNVFL